MAYTTINKSTDNFNTVLYTGNGSLPRAITGVGFQPDFVWLKDRDTAYNHQLYDAVRGTSAGVLYSNTNGAQDSAYQLSSFNSDGFTLGSNLGAVNENNKKIVSWNWKANGQGSSNTDGSINTTYTSANTTAGFSISNYVGTGSLATVGHGLGVAPAVIIIKNRSTTNGWEVYHQSLGNTKYIQLHTTAAASTSATRWNDTSPTNSVFTVNTENGVNKSGSNLVAYCFAEKTGYSKFGSYNATGTSNDGPFIYTGFKPSIVIIKKTNATDNWYLFDNTRNPFNPETKLLYPNLSDVEYTGLSAGWLNLVSNGFKVITSNAGVGGGDSYIYMAFGQSLVGTNNIPATAR